jgi:antitoxin component YwqK of YwqJK toxin-antitoxin module
MSYEQSATGMKYKDGGTSYDARFDGRQYPVSGNAGRAVMLKRLDDRTIDETWFTNGKEDFRGHMVISADGKTLTQANFRNGKQDGAPSVSTRVGAGK